MRSDAKKPPPNVVVKEEIEATYDKFAVLEDLPQVLAAFQRLCSLLDLKQSKFPTFFDQFKKSLRGYRKARSMCEEIYSALKSRGYVDSDDVGTPTSDYVSGIATEDTEYIMDDRPTPCSARKVFIVGGGPSGLRMAIESQLLGAKVLIVEMRTNFTRYNIAYLWQQAVDDLIGLNVRHFCKDFCSGSHNTISIRQLQFVLIKLALILGVEFYSGITFERLIEPDEEHGWRVLVNPVIPDVANFEFDVLIDASGKRNCVYYIDVPLESQTSESKMLNDNASKRITKTMIALAANFVYNGTAEERYEQIAGVSDLYKNAAFSIRKLEERGIGVETIVYYRRETHYFIMTLKKRTLKDHNLIKEEYDSLQRTLDAKNINKKNLKAFAIKVANLVTNTSMDSDNDEEHRPEINQFHITEDGKKNVAIFGYEALASASNSCKILQRKNKMLFTCLVGDSLIVPFWPEGTGVVKGFMSALDTCWVMKLWSLNETRITPLQLLGTKEYLYCHLRYMDKNGLIRSPKNFRPKLDPWCRYNRDSTFKKNHSHLRKLYDTDIDVKSKVMEQVQFFEVLCNESTDTNYGIGAMLDWYNELLSMLDITVVDITTCWRNGVALLAVICLWEPDFIDWLLLSDDDIENNQRAINILAVKFGIPPVMSAEEMANLDEKDEILMSTYLKKIMNFISTNYNDLIIETKTRIKLNRAEQHPPPPGKCLPYADKIKYQLGENILNKIKCRMGQRNDYRKRSPIEEEMIGNDDTTTKPFNEKEQTSIDAVMLKGAENYYKRTADMDERENHGMKKLKENLAETGKDLTVAEIEESEDLPDRQLESFTLEKSDLPPLINLTQVRSLNKQLKRTGSLPNMTVRMTNGECCIACNKLIHAAVRFVSVRGNPVHKNCLRCSECKRRLENTFYNEDEQSRKFYCRKHRIIEEQPDTIKYELCELESDLKDQKPNRIRRPSSLRNHFSEIDRNAKAPLCSILRSDSMTTAMAQLEPEFRARSMQLIQESPKALNILFKNKEVQDVILRVAMNNPELDGFFHEVERFSKEMGDEEAKQEERQSFVKERTISEQTDSGDEEDSPPVQLRLHNIALVSHRQQKDGKTGLRNPWVLKLDNEESTNSEDLVQAVNVFVQTNFCTDEDVPPKGTVANAVQRLNPVENHDTASRIHRTKSCPQLVKNKVLENCHYCQKRVYLTEKMTIYDTPFHRQCFKCQQCGVRLNLKTFDYDKETKRFLCFTHSKEECDLSKKDKIKHKTFKHETNSKHKWASNPNKWKLAQMSKKISKVFHIKEHHEMLEELEEDESLV